MGRATLSPGATRTRDQRNRMRQMRVRSRGLQRRTPGVDTDMYDYSRQTPYAADYGTAISVAEKPAVLGKVLALLGFAFVFTAGGAVIGRSLGPGAFLISIVGALGTLIALNFAREKSPLNLGLLYAFATFEGLALGLILESYVARGLGGVVLNAALTTAAVTVAAGGYGYTTKHDLSG